jgi:hypothetical protein
MCNQVLLQMQCSRHSGRASMRIQLPRVESAQGMQVLSPPYICSRMHVWSGTNYFFACLLLIKSKAGLRDRLEFVDHHDQDGRPEAATVSCLMELSMLFFSYGWLSSARHCCLWGILENEASTVFSAGLVRYELVGHFVDINIGLLQRSCVHDVAVVLTDALTWVLAMLRLTMPPMLALNSVFVQRLSKVLHCCMLRLPEREQREVCGRSVMALYRLALSRFRRQFAQPVASMPVPLIDCALLTTMPLGSTGKGGSAWDDLVETKLVRRIKHDGYGLHLLARWAQHGPSAVRGPTLPVLVRTHWQPLRSALLIQDGGECSGHVGRVERLMTCNVRAVRRF